jgi:hypothetical protein
VNRPPLQAEQVLAALNGHGIEFVIIAPFAAIVSVDSHAAPA